MELRHLYILTLSLSLLMVSCQSENEEETTDSEQNTGEATAEGLQDEMADDLIKPLVIEKAVESEGITITPLTSSPTYDNSILTFENLSTGDQLEASKKVIKMDVENYELGVQTSDAKKKGLANSANGQHMHVILNNKPYMAHYDPEVEVELEDGHYVALAFFSRSYHESVKSPNAFDIIQFGVGDADPNQADLSAPHIFYSRPKGTYTGADTKEVLFDFYLLNTKLDEQGNKVRLTINDQAEFYIAKWQAYTITGLPMGENKFEVELIDEKGETIETPFNPMERTIILEEEAS